MIIQAELHILILATSFLLSLQSPCKIAVHCPCGSTGNTTKPTCVDDGIADEPCSKWPGCVMCPRGQECLECRGDPQCTEDSAQQVKHRRKRQSSTSNKAGCRDPGLISNGIRKINGVAESYTEERRNFQDGDSLEFSCVSQAFDLEGSPILTCSDGLWSSSRPKCIRSNVKQVCSDPGFVKNGRRVNEIGIRVTTIQTFQDGESVQFNCKSEEFELEGSPIMTCSDGSWSNSKPKCVQRGPLGTDISEKKGCNDPGFITNGNRKKQDERKTFQDGDSVEYSCKSEKFYLDGSSVLICSDGTWSSPKPRCIRSKECSDPGFIQDGNRRRMDDTKSESSDRQTFYEGESVVFNCKSEEFTLEGSSVLTCNDGSWSASTPTCNRLSPVIVTKKICRNPGYIRNGDRRNMDGTRGENAASEMYEDGESVVYRCNDKFILEGSSILTCLEGLWSQPKPVCNPITGTGEVSLEVRCPDPGQVPNADRLNTDRSPSQSSQQYRVGQSVVYTCHVDFALQYSSFITCTASGTWSNRLPICRPIASTGSSSAPEVPSSIEYCANPGPISNGIRDYYSPTNELFDGSIEDLDDQKYPHPVGVRLEYWCDDGYELLGEEALYCEPGGSWSSDPPVCKEDKGPKSCSNPWPISNGRPMYLPAPSEGRRGPMEVPNEDAFPEGASLQYACNNGYILEGAETLTCQSDGIWSHIPPSCWPKVYMMTCRNRGFIENGRGTYTFPDNGTPATNNPKEFPVGTILRYSCVDGYDLKGESEMACLKTGFWSVDSIPTCETECGISSGSTGKIINGYNATAGDWPWVVAIAVEENGYSEIVCGGALWSSSVVVTAAHCLIRGDIFTLYFGKLYRNNAFDQNVQVRTSKRVIKHESFNSTTYDFDIALLMFDHVTLTNWTRPICPPTHKMTARHLKTGEEGYVTGWGVNEMGVQSDRLLMAVLPYQSTKDCMEAYRRQKIKFEITGNMFCAGLEEAEQSTCKGDSGSPLVFYDRQEKKWVLLGLVSFGVIGQCGLPQRYTMFTNVYNFLPWILQQIEAGY